MLTVKDLHKSYQVGKTTYEVLKGVSLSVETGEFVAVMGPSGSGKTTLLNCISCYIPADSGQITLGTEELARLDEDALAAVRNRKLGFVFQDFLLLDGLFGQLGAPFQLLLSRKRERGRRRLCILLGLCCVIPLLMLVAPLLASADALFDRLTAETLRFLYEHFGSLLGRLVLGLFLAPFLFSLLYFLRRGEARATGAGQEGTFVVDPALPVTVLLPLDLLYVLFAAVQSAALFRGSAYLEAAGISYAEYARSGFFQLVWVSCINLAVVVAAVHFCRREGKLWLVVWALSTGMVALSCLMLVSAAWRMTLYVSTYGLSVKRLLTYWGMALLAVFFGAALLKIWRRDFGFFRVLLAAGVSGWLLLNLLRVDAVVAEYNVEAYLTGNISALDVAYLAGLSDEALPSLARLPADMSVYEYEEGNTVGRLLEERRVHAARMAGSWRTWNLASWRAARSG